DALPIGMTVSLGALCISITDAPGPIVHKRNSMLAGLVFVFASAFITGFARMNPYTLGLEIFLAAFLFSMFAIYGARAAGVGSAALLILILTMDQPLHPSDVLLHTLLITAGGLWYMLISLAFHIIRPYRAAQRSLGLSIRELARYIEIKANFYDTGTSMDQNFQQLMAQQVVINQKQDATRELMFKSRQIVKETTSTSSRLLLTFVNTVDMFEDVTATYYDYDGLRRRFAQFTVLQNIASLIRQLAYELDRAGIAIVADMGFEKRFHPDAQLEGLKQQIDELGSQGFNVIVLRKVLINIRRLTDRLNDIAEYFSTEKKEAQKSNLEYHRFVSSQPLHPRIFLDNLSFSSSIFRYALRVAIACLVGYFITQAVAYGQHSYWILLTIAFIMKPAYSLTKQRNVERIIGTVAGGLIGVAILLLVRNESIQFLFMVLFMLGTYTFARSNYIAMVICVTPFVLILFKFVGIGFIDVAQERVLDTVIGCVIAFLASSMLFPNWEKEGLKEHMQKMLEANIAYLHLFAQTVAGQTISILDYKLVRKNVYIHSANLSAAFQRMTSEPKTKQHNKKEIHQFVVLNHILFSNIAAFTSGKQRKTPYPDEVKKLLKRTLSALCGVLQKLDTTYALPPISLKVAEKSEKVELGADDALLKGQLEFILKISNEMERIISRFAAAEETTPPPVHNHLAPTQ
ncbi:MAG: FUSC family membrane protein, partial [Chitinophagaceae bacterium]